MGEQIKTESVPRKPLRDAFFNCPQSRFGFEKPVGQLSALQSSSTAQLRLCENQRTMKLCQMPFSVFDHFNWSVLLSKQSKVRQSTPKAVGMRAPPCSDDELVEWESLV